MNPIATCSCLVLLLLGHASAMAKTSPFPGLHTLEVVFRQGPSAVDSGIPVKVHYDPALSELTPLPNNPRNDDSKYQMLTTRLDRRGGERVIVFFSPGPSDDPGFTLVRSGDGQSLGHLPGVELVVPGNGSLSTSGHSNNAFNQRRAYRFGNGGLEEVKQPFYYVGLESRAKRDLSITSDKEGEEEVALLPKGSKVTVLLNDGDAYLLKTPFGLVGWLRLSDLGWRDDDLEGLFRRGD